VGEFGRTPRVNNDAGRDHYPNVFSAALAGGPIKGGRVLGESDSIGAFPKTNPKPPQDVLATIYRHLGIDTTKQYLNNAGRPIVTLRSAPRCWNCPEPLTPRRRGIMPLWRFQHPSFLPQGPALHVAGSKESKRSKGSFDFSPLARRGRGVAPHGLPTHRCVRMIWSAVTCHRFSIFWLVGPRINETRLVPETGRHADCRAAPSRSKIPKAVTSPSTS